MSDDNHFIDASINKGLTSHKVYLIQFWNNGYKWNYVVKAPNVEDAIFAVKKNNELFAWNKIEDIKVIEELE